MEEKQFDEHLSGALQITPFHEFTEENAPAGQVHAKLLPLITKSIRTCLPSTLEVAFLRNFTKESNPSISVCRIPEHILP